MPDESPGWAMTRWENSRSVSSRNSVEMPTVRETGLNERWPGRVGGTSPLRSRRLQVRADRPCRPTGEFMPRERHSSGSVSPRVGLEGSWLERQWQTEVEAQSETQPDH